MALKGYFTVVICTVQWIWEKRETGARAHHDKMIYLCKARVLGATWVTFTNLDNSQQRSH